jgi:hypothetical protein
MDFSRWKINGGFETMQRILCPTDLTSDSKDSVAYALQIAKENDAQLTVFHVISFPDFRQYPCPELDTYYQWEQVVSKFRMDQLLATAERRLKNFVGARLAIESKDVAWKPRVAFGKVAAEIVATAGKRRFDRYGSLQTRDVGWMVSLECHRSSRQERALSCSVDRRVAFRLPASRMASTYSERAVSELLRQGERSQISLSAALGRRRNETARLTHVSGSRA